MARSGTEEKAKQVDKEGGGKIVAGDPDDEGSIDIHRWARFWIAKKEGRVKVRGRPW